MDIFNIPALIKRGKLVSTLLGSEFLTVSRKTTTDAEYENIAISIDDLITQIVDAVPPYTPPAAPYKVYSALLTQTSTNAPVATVLQNTLGFTPSWVYLGVGNYQLHQTAGFPDANKVEIFFGAPTVGITDRFRYLVGSANAVTFDTYTGNTPAAANGCLSKTAIEVRIYS